MMLIIFSEQYLEIVYNHETSEFEATKHKHADLIMKFAEIAQTDTKNHGDTLNILVRYWIDGSR